jgi:biopolymer transport protein ExbB
MDNPETTLLDLLAQGGWAMYPLGLLSFGTLALSVMGWQMTRPKWFAVETANGMWQRCAAYWNARIGMAADDRPDLSTEAAADAFMDGVEREQATVAQAIHYLNVIAMISPMVGLLGTVSGMIGAFQTIATGGMGKPELLAGDIGEALVTTATGLIISIPAMLGYFVLKNRLQAGTQRLIDQFHATRPPAARESDRPDQLRGADSGRALTAVPDVG